MISHDNLTAMGSQLTQLVKTGRFIDTQIQCSDATFKVSLYKVRMYIFLKNLCPHVKKIYTPVYREILVLGVNLQYEVEMTFLQFSSS